ncbi:hypothetical protein LH392_09130 [Corynebacterium uberis]|uniref:xylulokinase n=1 Tax=Corynebacterium uberis TaxID=2883169 RepID=UPI001D0B26CD|nr:FGGY-family carbohydrate kinase [Corynebacterium uberis]UDL75328.1 hypothetical protein LH393_08715 [Corynebacterium uberis]UDL79826.1 hypothetical protein LH392_09130 [Corynebacterium uberis]
MTSTGTPTLIPSDALYLGIELGSTRIKACAVDASGTTVATGASEWENTLVDGHWSYPLDDVWKGLQQAYSQLAHALAEHTIEPRFRALGVSAMMHGYLAFDDRDEQLVPFRTWRDTYTGPAAEELTALFSRNIPLRWSIAHLYQAILDSEQHVADVAFFTTLAGYVHWKLTGRKVLGVGDAVGMFPIDTATGDYDATMVSAFDALVADRPGPRIAPLRELLPEVLSAGEPAGTLTAEGARLIDPTGALRPGIQCCPPEGDAGTGMVATNAVRPRTGNVSVGTSIFAMVVQDEISRAVHAEIDPVATPDGSPVAMVHCNNGTNELSAWMELFAQVDVAFGHSQIANMDDVYQVLLTEALAGDEDAGGLLAYNYLSGEPITGLDQGRPLIVRGPTSTLSVSNFLRAQVYAAFATLELGMRILREEGTDIDVLFAHGGLFRTKGVGQRLLSAALNTPVGVAESAAEGGAWGIAILARYLDAEAGLSLPDFLDKQIFANATPEVVEPRPAAVEGFEQFLARYEAGLGIQRVAVELLGD